MWAYNLSKKQTPEGLSSWLFESLKNIHFTEYLRAAASGFPDEFFSKTEFITNSHPNTLMKPNFDHTLNVTKKNNKKA